MSKDYGFDYSDGDDASDGGAPDLENLYYLAKCKLVVVILLPRLSRYTAKKEDEPEEALQKFKEIPPLEQPKGDWCVYPSAVHSSY